MRKEFQFWKMCQNFSNERAPNSEPCLELIEYVKYFKITNCPSAYSNYLSIFIEIF